MRPCAWPRGSQSQIGVRQYPFCWITICNKGGASQTPRHYFSRVENSWQEMSGFTPALTLFDSQAQRSMWHRMPAALTAGIGSAEGHDEPAECFHASTSINAWLKPASGEVK